MKLPREFYTRSDVVQIAQELIGKKLVTQIDGARTEGMIVETEAYCGENDKACHAYLNRKTERTRVFYEEGGLAYVYLCYGIHHLFNIITNKENKADAVLIRAVEPIQGLDIMQQRRGIAKVNRRLTGGPGSMSQAMGIHTDHYGEYLLGKRIWLEQHQEFPKENLLASARVGIDYAEEDALLPWRFRLKDNSFTSPAK